MIFKENAKPIFMQIADRICDEVMAGTFAEGSRIPSVRDYAATLQVNANTVMRSYEHLTREGIIFNRRGIGFFIAEDARTRITLISRETFLGEELTDIFRRLNLLGITPDGLKERYEKYLNDSQK